MMQKIKDFFKKIFLFIPSYLRLFVLLFFIFLLLFILNEYILKSNSNSNDLITDTIKVNKTNNNFQIKDNTTNNTTINDDKITGEVNVNLESAPSVPSLRNKNTKLDKNLELKEEDYYFGSNEAKVTIVEYSSYNCPHCLSLHNNIMSNLKKDYIDTNKVKYAKKVFIQKNSMLGVLLPYCAKPENQYALVEDLYVNLRSWLNSRKQKEKLEVIALRNGFTKQEFDDCMKNAKLVNKIIKNQQQEARKLKIFSTPTLFINNQRITGSKSYDKIKTIIEEELAANN